MRAAPGRQGYSLLRGGEEGMSPAELRALPVVIHERRHRHSPPVAEARAPSSYLPRALPAKHARRAPVAAHVRMGGTLVLSARSGSWRHVRKACRTVVVTKSPGAYEQRPASARKQTGWRVAGRGGGAVRVQRLAVVRLQQPARAQGRRHAEDVRHLHRGLPVRARPHLCRPAWWTQYLADVSIYHLTWARGRHRSDDRRHLR